MDLVSLKRSTHRLLFCLRLPLLVQGWSLSLPTHCWRQQSAHWTSLRMWAHRSLIPDGGRLMLNEMRPPSQPAAQTIRLNTPIWFGSSCVTSRFMRSCSRVSFKVHLRLLHFPPAGCLRFVQNDRCAEKQTFLIGDEHLVLSITNL